MRRINRALIWLRRIGHGRGFGVQSPNDYRFLRNVINQDSPFYKYDELKKTVRCHGSSERKICQLYFRLANFVQADFFLEINTIADGVSDYVAAACRKTKNIRISLPTTQMPENCKGKVLLVRCSLEPDVEELLMQIIMNSDERTVIVSDHIYQNDEVLEYWNRISNDKHVTISYDLYHCGILLMENRRYKKKYFVNF